MRIGRSTVAFCVLMALAPSSAALSKTSTIVYATYAIKTETDLLAKVVFPRFEALNPGYKVKLFIDGGYMDKLVSMMAAGKGPDCFQVEEGMLPFFFQANQLLDLAPYIKRDKLDVDAIAGAAAKNLLWDMTTAALPYHVVTSAIYYNRTMFALNGLSDPDPTWTWTDFVLTAKRLTKDTNSDGKPDFWGYNILNHEMNWGPFLWGNGGRFYDRQMFAKKVTANTDEAISAFRFLQEMLYKQQVAPFGDNGIFMSGKVAMVHDGSWAGATFRQGVKGFDWDVALFPRSPRTNLSSARLSAGAGAIWRGSKQKDGAWKLLKFLATDEVVQRAKAKSAIFAPLTKQQTQWPEYYPTTVTPRSAGRVFYESLANATVETVFPNTRARDIMYTAVGKVLANKTDPSDAMRTLAVDLGKNLEQHLAKKR